MATHSGCTASLFTTKTSATTSAGGARSADGALVCTTMRQLTSEILARSKMSFRSAVKLMKRWPSREYSQRRCPCGGLLILRCNINSYKIQGHRRARLRVFYKRCNRCKVPRSDPKTYVMNGTEDKSFRKLLEKESPPPSQK